MQLKLEYIAEESELNHNNMDFPALEVLKLNDKLERDLSFLIEQSGIKDFSPYLEVWTSSASTKALSYLSHGIFRYFGKFPPPIASHLIREFSKEGELILDPMCGSGTTGLECLISGRKAICMDVNPLSALISRAKVTRLNYNNYINSLENVLNIANKLNDESEIQLVGLKDPLHWFLPETIKSISRIKHAIRKLDASIKVKEALLVALLAIVRRVSKATTQQGRLFLDVKTAEKDAIKFFENKAREIIEPLSLLPENEGNISVIEGSILADSFKFHDKAKLIICHPPYFNAYKYSRINSLELAWLGKDSSEVRKSEVREAFKVGKFEKVDEYLDDMEKGLQNLQHYLSDDGILALMIGDTVLKGRFIPVSKKLIQRLKKLYSVVFSSIRIPKFTEASWAASQRRNSEKVGINMYDFIIILRKNI